ncbi:MAG: tRNA pseudouridine(55) synthase TruB, partial [Acidobacteriota bacterium]|nr:tRNA pseudouridine(55) synthase TruB [Acidobacteriota bacterium]
LGTLDPIATGVLPLVVGRATRLAQFYKRADKSYEAIVRFGFSTDSYDRAGTATMPETEPVVDAGQLESALEKMRGRIQQLPPPVSAKKVAGVPAYKLARRHIDPALKPVEVEIYELDVRNLSGALALLHVRCSAGTYVRTIAHEAGLALGCGAHVHALRRTASGEFAIQNARTIAELEASSFDALIAMPDLLPQFPNVVVDDLTAGQIRHGRDFHASPFRAQAGTQYVKALSANGEVIAIGEAKFPNVYHPVIVM